MAAVLCKSIGDLCALPCVLLGKCCSGGCKGCAIACKECGNACNGVCRGCDSLFRLLCRNPFSPFVAVALFTQGPSIFLVIPGLGGIPDCTQSLYLVANSILAAVNVGTAFYLAYKIVDTSSPEMAHLDTAFKRASHLLCNDCWIAIYICLFIGFMCVQAWGSVASFQNFFDNDLPADDQICPSSVESMVRIATSLGWAFCFLGFAALVFSLCCAKFDNADYSPEANNGTTNNHNTDPTVPQGSYDANHQSAGTGSASYNAQGVPNNDFVQPQDSKKTGKPSATSTPTYTQQGIPANDFVAPNNPPPRAQAPPPQEEIPMAFAEEIPQASAPPSEYDVPPTGGGTSGYASASASAPPPAAGGNTAVNPNDHTTTGAKVGGTAGKQIGKMFTKDETKQQKIAQQGQKAGEALETGFFAAKNFVQSKMKKDDKK